MRPRGVGQPAHVVLTLLCSRSWARFDAQASTLPTYARNWQSHHHVVLHHHDCVCMRVCVLDPADLPHHRHVLLAGCTFARAQGAASCVAHAWLTLVCHVSLFQCPCGECQAAQYNLRCLRFPHHCPSTTAAVAPPTDALQGVSDEVASSLRGFLARMQSHETPVSNDLDFCLDGTCGSSYVGCCLAVRAVWVPFAATAAASLTHCARFVLRAVPVINSCGVPACDRADACPISARAMRRRHAMCAVAFVVVQAVS